MAGTQKRLLKIIIISRSVGLGVGVVVYWGFVFYYYFNFAAAGNYVENYEDYACYEGNDSYKTDNCVSKGAW